MFVNAHFFSIIPVMIAPPRPRAGIKCYTMDGCLFLVSDSGFKGFKTYILWALIVVRAHHLHRAPLPGVTHLSWQRGERGFDREVSEQAKCPGGDGGGQALELSGHVSLLKGSALEMSSSYV